jgi:hypothetical protein
VADLFWSLLFPGLVFCYNLLALSPQGTPNMLSFGSHRVRSPHGVTRRELLQIGGSAVLGLSLPEVLRIRAQSSVSPAKAKSVMLLWLWGGPSHLDTFDPKPDAPVDFRGPFSSIATKIPGIRFGELFPKLAARADRLAVLRSLKTGSNDHGVAGTIGLTGSQAGAKGLNGIALPGSPRPTIGSTVARVKGFSGKLPPFLVVGGKLHQGLKPIVGEGGGALGGLYDPFRLVYDPELGTRIPSLALPSNLSIERLGDRKALLKAFDRVEHFADSARSVRVLDDYRRQALAMITNPTAQRAFDLSKERETDKERYGLTRFGQSCLLGRRLVEHGVPFVQVNWSDHVEAEEDAGDGGWDHHYRNFQLMQDRHGPWMDQAISALLDDLHERGLLQTTLVLAVGEFGRSPKINDKAGREHWEHCYSGLVFGGGVRGGRVIGSSTAKGEHVHNRPISPADLIATVQAAVGVTSEQAQTLNVALDTGHAIEELY